MIGWFRVPPWCLSVHDEESAPRARAWVYLLGAWDAGDDPPTREVRRVTGFGQGRADKLVCDVAAWAIENGARLPTRVAEQHRSGVGAGAEQADKGTTPKAKQRRSGVGAASEQHRSVSRARFLLQGEETVNVDADEDSAPASGAGTLTQQQEHEPCPSPRTDAPNVTASAEPSGSLAPNASEARTTTARTTSGPTSMTLPPNSTPTPWPDSRSTNSSGPTSETPASFAATDAPPPPSDEDYYAATDTIEAEPTAPRTVGAMAQPREATPPAPQRRTAATPAEGADEGWGPRSGAIGAPQVVESPPPMVVLTPNLFAALNGPSAAPVTVTHAPVSVEGVGAKGGASGRGKRAPKPPAEPKPVPVANRLIGEWKASHLEAHGEEYAITPVCAKKLRELVKDEPADADLSAWRAAFDAFNRKGFGTSPKGFTAMGFSYDPVLWQQTAKAYAAGVNPNRRPNTNDDNRRASIAMLDHALAQLENK